MNLESVEDQFRDEIQRVRSAQELLELKARFLGKKGQLSSVLHQLGSLPPEERPRVGAQANELKLRIEQECVDRLERLKGESQKKVVGEVVDVTLPGRSFERGRLHPVTQVMEEVERIFTSFGFDIFEGPEVESDHYNFEALNIPANHPARDMQDTFYIDGGAIHESPLLLRTHTSPVQIHVMEKYRPPIRMIAPGVVYRRDEPDASHACMFHQVEGLVVDEGIRFSDLKGTISRFLNLFFEREMEILFRASYFPFTEPSAEVAIRWKDSWLEIMGCGMVHPNVFRHVGYDPKKVTGFAFGVGVERLAMLKRGIPDLRLFAENDLRFLEQM